MAKKDKAAAEDRAAEIKSRLDKHLEGWEAVDIDGPSPMWKRDYDTGHVGTITRASEDAWMPSLRAPGEESFIECSDEPFAHPGGAAVIADNTVEQWRNENPDGDGDAGDKGGDDAPIKKPNKTPKLKKGQKPGIKLEAPFCDPGKGKSPIERVGCLAAAIEQYGSHLNHCGTANSRVAALRRRTGDDRWRDSLSRSHQNAAEAKKETAPPPLAKLDNGEVDIDKSIGLMFDWLANQLA